MKYYTTTTEFNCGIDLHSKRMYVCIMDRTGRIRVHQNIRGNDFGHFLKLAQPAFANEGVAPGLTAVEFWAAAGL
ncbi:MAG: hypothetical protein EOM72_06885 [Opitutae bacterium]|nr:hypothetical protein [Opitutae bacterium]